MRWRKGVMVKSWKLLETSTVGYQPNGNNFQDDSRTPRAQVE
jgi:hypothetical protein